MAYITKRGSSYSVRYTYQDEHGKSCDKWESFPTKEEATNRKKQIEHELAAGTFLIPSSVTVAEFLMDWLPKQCSKHKWAPKTYESNLSTIQLRFIYYYFLFFREIFGEIFREITSRSFYFSELLAFPLKLLPARADSQFWQSFSDAV